MSKPKIKSHFSDEWRDITERAIYATTKDEADACLMQMATMAQDDNPALSAEEAVRIQRGNLGYLAANFTHADRLRVEALYDTVHPEFGPAKEGPIPPTAAFRLGLYRGRVHALEEQLEHLLEVLDDEQFHFINKRTRLLLDDTIKPLEPK